MRRAAFAAVLLGLLFAGAPARGEERITDFRADIAVAADGALSVAETIAVHPEGDQIRRGIYRDISTTFEDAGGRVHRVAFDIESLTRDGKPEPYHLERHGDYVRVFMGAEDVFLPVGVDTTYVLTYSSDRQVRWIDGQAELFWNVTGNGWTFPIRAAIARVALPGNAAPTRWDAYTGRAGERGTAFRGSVDGGVLSIATTRALAPGEGLTLVVGIPEGAVARPTKMQEFLYALRDSAAWIIGITGMVGIFVYYLVAWNRVGRDPARGTIIPLFHPPAGVSPALAVYIDKWGIDSNTWQAFTGSALALAVRGLIVFDQSDSDLVLERTDMPSAPVRDTLPAGERAVLDWVDGQSGRAAITKANGAAVQKVTQAFRAAVKSEGGNRYFRRNLGFFTFGIVLSVLLALGIVAFGGLDDDEIGLMIGLGVVGIFLGVVLSSLISALMQRKGVMTILITLLVAAVVVGQGFSAIGSLLQDASGGFAGLVSGAFGAHAFPLAIVLLLPTLNGVFYLLLAAPTAEGRPVMDQLEGFRLYMQTAESGRLNIAKAPEIDAAHFEAVLPYAVALGVEKPWANAFAASLARAYPSDPDPMTHYNARWRRGGSWSGTDFGRSLSTAVASASSAMASAIPRSSSDSSGFSGGSGGGGGGRGGGGW